jgi:hypothetical protein
MDHVAPAGRRRIFAVTLDFAYQHCLLLRVLQVTAQPLSGNRIRSTASTRTALSRDRAVPSGRYHP